MRKAKFFNLCFRGEVWENVKSLAYNRGQQGTFCLYQRLWPIHVTQTHKQTKKHFCMCCHNCFTSESVLEKHRENCIIINGVQAIKMPEKGTTINF